MTDNHDILAPEHWTVEKTRRLWDSELKTFRINQKRKLQNIRVNSKKKVAALHERIFFTLRWANPQLPGAYKKLILDYCDHLMGPNPQSMFQSMRILDVWNLKFMCSDEAKVCENIKYLCNQLSDYIINRNHKYIETLANTEVTTEKLLIKKENQVKWTIETKKSIRDEYWTIWYLSANGLVPELHRFLASYLTNNDIDTRDPDYGYTALHYSVKKNQLTVLNILLDNGADENALILEDNRSPLHLCAQYGSREIALELLARGADYYALDNYNCTALQLAIQNKNMSVVHTLENWLIIVPEIHQDEDTLVASNIPQECEATAEEVMHRMSPALRVISDRLDKLGSFVDRADRGIELRLCEKKAEMCFKEGLNEEALKSLRRRWLVVKIVYDEAAASELGDNTSSTIELNDTNKNSKVAVLPTAQDCYDVQQHDSLGAVSVVAQGQVQERANTNGAESLITPSFAWSICSALVEHLISIKEVKSASQVLDELLQRNILQFGNDSLLVACLLRRCQVLLFLSDAIITELAIAERQGSNSEKKRKKNSVADLAVFADSVSHNQKDTNLQRLSHTNSNTIPVSSSEQPLELAVPSLESHQSSFVHFESDMGHFQVLQTQALHRRNHPTCDPLLRAHTAPAHMGIELENSHIENSQVESYNMIESFKEDHEHASSVILPSMNISHIQHTEEVLVDPRLAELDDILAKSDMLILQAIDIVNAQYTGAFIEPVQLCPLLEIAAEISDRQGRYTDALHYMEHCSIISERVVGKFHSETVRYKIEVLRLLLRKGICYAIAHGGVADSNHTLTSLMSNSTQTVSKIKSNFRQVGLYATDVSRRLDQLTISDPNAALALSQKCYKLVSLTELINVNEIKAHTLHVRSASVHDGFTSSKYNFKALNVNTFNHSRLKL